MHRVLVILGSRGLLLAGSWILGCTCTRMAKPVYRAETEVKLLVGRSLRPSRAKHWKFSVAFAPSPCLAQKWTKWSLTCPGSVSQKSFTAGHRSCVGRTRWAPLTSFPSGVLFVCPWVMHDRVPREWLFWICECSMRFSVGGGRESGVSLALTLSPESCNHREGSFTQQPSCQAIFIK